MNPNPTPDEQTACLDLLYRSLVQIRVAAFARDAERVVAVADALHNLPHLLTVGHEQDWSLAAFDELFLQPLIARYPDLAIVPLTSRQ